MKMRQDCYFFLPDRPCNFHKEQGVLCPDCVYYQPCKGRILLIKREALGDVLRTTSVLRPLRKEFPAYKIIWLTAANSKDILRNNPFLDEVWTDDSLLSWSSLNFLCFDVVINLDLDAESLLLAGRTTARKKLGFWYDRSGRVFCSNPAAEEWFVLSHDDGAKRANILSYQRWMAKILGLQEIGEIVVPLVPESEKRARIFAEKNKLTAPVVGLNLGSGTRWITKRWPEENWLKLIVSLKDKATVLLFGGQQERELMSRLKKRCSNNVIPTGTSNSLLDFFALLNLCQVVVTGDTLALHVAAGLGKKVVAVFGPTSASEIEDYGLVCKLVTPASCACCYRRQCPDYPACMEAIQPEEVSCLVQRLLHERI